MPRKLMARAFVSCRGVPASSPLCGLFAYFGLSECDIVVAECELRVGAIFHNGRYNCEG